MSDEDDDDAPLETDELLAEIVMAMVDLPDAVRIEKNSGTGSFEDLYIVHCAPRDRGVVIGKRGDAIQALRTLLGRVAARQGRRVVVEVADSRADRTTVYEHRRAVS